MLLGLGEAILHLGGRDIVQVYEACLAGHDRVHVAEEPVHIEVVLIIAPAPQNRAHALPAGGPFGTDLGECEVALR